MKALGSLVWMLRFHCWSRGILYSGPAIRSESWEDGVRGTKPSVVVGNSFWRSDWPLAASVLVNPYANGAAVKRGAFPALALDAGAW